MLQSAREWKSTPGEAQKFGLQQHPGKQNKTKTKKSSYWRLDDENEDDGDDDDTRELKNHDDDFVDDDRK